MVTPTDMLYSAFSNLDIQQRATTDSLLDHVVSTSDLALPHPIDINSRVPQLYRGKPNRHTLVC